MDRAFISDWRVHIGSPLPLTFSAVQALWSAMSQDKESVLLGCLNGKRKSDSKRDLTTELRKWREGTRYYLMRYSTCIAGKPRKALMVASLDLYPLAKLLTSIFIHISRQAMIYKGNVLSKFFCIIII